MIFIPKLMDFILKIMDLVLKIMNFLLKMMDFLPKVPPFTAARSFSLRLLNPESIRFSARRSAHRCDLKPILDIFRLIRPISEWFG